MIIYESSYYGVVPLGDYVEHVGVKGTHWGVRRWQNEDGSLTPHAVVNTKRKFVLTDRLADKSTVKVKRQQDTVEKLSRRDTADNSK